MTVFCSLRRVTSCAIAAALAAGLLAGPPASADDPPVEQAPACTPRVLVLAAFPAEIERLLTELQASAYERVVVDDRRFYVGTVGAHDVVLAMTGIGINNAAQTTHAAYEAFGCGDGSGISAAVFSGVSGGRNIGDVMVPDRWTDDGESYWSVDAAMLASAQSVASTVALAKTTPLGDPACVCQDSHLVEHVAMEHDPEVVFGGDGTSADPFGGRTFPCTPNGGDVFGCEPCQDQSGDPPDAVGYAQAMAPFLDPEFFFGYFEAPPETDPQWAAQDMETAAVARIAVGDHGTPFIAFRAASDGAGDPLNLPGFPFQFFAYRQLAADNAAAMTLAFLEEWAAESGVAA
jgi:nucleoside phosphorylase